MSTTTAVTIGQRLRHERERRSWSQKTLAEKLNIPVRTINRWETDKTLPHPYNREILCTLFEMSVDVLFGELIHAPLWFVRSPRNLYFTGREEEFEQVHNALAAHRTVALTGLGGIGKTQMALEYAYRYAHDYHTVLWVRADSRESLVSDLITLATELNLPEKQQANQAEIMAAVLRWFRRTKGWLLILDNADTLEMICEFLPQWGEGALVVTTRSQVTGAHFKTIAITKMRCQEAVRFLLTRSKLIEDGSLLDQLSSAHEETAHAAKIWELMDGLPLALDQAAAYIEEHQCRLLDYLNLYQKNRSVLLGRRGALQRDYPASVATAWSLSFKQVEQDSPAAADVLRLCAFLHPDAIPEEMLVGGAATLGPALRMVVQDAAQWEDTIATLLAYSLLRRHAETKTLSMHRLVQEVLKDAMNEETYWQWAGQVVRVVNQAFPTVRFRSWSRCERYLSHAQRCAELIKGTQIRFPEAARLLNQAGAYLTKRAQYVEAEPLLQQALEMREQLDPEHAETARSLHDLALLYYNQGKYREAEPLYLRALEIHEHLPAFMPIDTAENVHHLAILYRDQSKYEQAEALFDRALALLEPVVEAHHSLLASVMVHVGVCYWYQAKYEQAESFYLRVLDMQKQVLDPNHPFIASIFLDLAWVYAMQGKYGQAEQFTHNALQMLEQIFGANHPDAALVLTGLGWLYWMQGKYTEAIPLFERGITIYEQSPGLQQRSELGLLLNGLAQTSYLQGHDQQAEALFERALVFQEHQLPADHRDIALTLHGLWQLYRYQGREEQARVVRERLLAMPEAHRTWSRNVLWRNCSYRERASHHDGHDYESS